MLCLLSRNNIDDPFGWHVCLSYHLLGKLREGVEPLRQEGEHLPKHSSSSMGGHAGKGREARELKLGGGIKTDLPCVLYLLSLLLACILLCGYAVSPPGRARSTLG